MLTVLHGDGRVKCPRRGNKFVFDVSARFLSADLVGFGHDPPVAG